MSKPLAPWEQTNSFTDEKLVWAAQLDNRYQVEVQRIDASTGNLLIFDHEDDDKEIYTKTVTMMFGAMFGPDAEDVGLWADMAAEYVDGLKQDQT